MAQLIAPYHNGMRLGQGFNSYNQQICLDNAVLLDNEENRKRVRDYYVADKYLHKSGRDFLPIESKPHHEDGVIDTQENSAGDIKHAKLLPWTKPQIVTYSSRFVDTLKDVTGSHIILLVKHIIMRKKESMNISGALSIQVGTIGGKGSGSYIDSDKFKESNINFHLQVKVVNQIQKFDDYKLFNKIHNMPVEDFTAVYGDSFISGWEEGGEFNAIISMKVTDKSKVYKIKADLEVKMGRAGVEVKAEAHGEIDKESTDKSTETTIAVNWSGGGSIKEPEEPWTIETMTKAAAAFPEMVAMTPQRTYAILTKYSALESFQRQIERYSLLDYENAVIYTNMLMEHFMEYKMMWKQISQATYELQRGTARAEWGEITDRLSKQATIKPLPNNQMNAKLKQTLPPASKLKAIKAPDTTDGQSSTESLEATTAEGDSHMPDFLGGVAQDARNAATSAQRVLDYAKAAEASAGAAKEIENSLKNSKDGSLKEDLSHDSITMQIAAGATKVTIEGETRLQFHAFYPDFSGLIAARKVCRYEMAKIVNEVDLITTHPKLALDTRRDEYFLEPLIFRQLLPVVRTWSDDLLPDPSQADAPIILGWVSRQDGGKSLPDVCTIIPKPEDIQTDLKTSIDKVQRKAKNYRMLGLVGTDQAAIGTNQADISTKARFFNDLETLDPTYRPSIFAVWVNNNVVQGIQFIYTNGVEKSHGVIDLEKPCYSITLQGDGSEMIFEMQFGTSIVTTKEAPGFHETIISSIKVITSKYNVMDTTKDEPKDHPNNPKVKQAKEDESKSKQPKKETDSAPLNDKQKTGPASTGHTAETRKRPDVGVWSLRGFFGFLRGENEKTRFLSLGDIWGKDKFVPRPPVLETLPLCKSFFDSDSTIQYDIGKIYGERKQFAGRYIMGDILTINKSDGTHFNHLRQMKLGWKIESISFGTKVGKLTGIKTTWTNGIFDIQGIVPTAIIGDERSWTCQVAPNLLLSAKITKVKVGTEVRIQTVEFIRSESASGSLPSWLLDLSTLRYIGDNETRALEGEPVVESAPDFDSGLWSVRGFYGIVSAQPETITGLGVIWGRDN